MKSTGVFGAHFKHAEGMSLHWFDVTTGSFRRRGGDACGPGVCDPEGDLKMQCPVSGGYRALLLDMKTVINGNLSGFHGDVCG